MNRCLIVAWLLCAWVLWEQTVVTFPDRSDKLVQVVDSAESKKECLTLLAREVRFHATRQLEPGYGRGSVSETHVAVFWPDLGKGKTVEVHSFQCAPVGVEARWLSFR